MVYLQLFILAVALAADAFSVAASVGLINRQSRQVFRLSFHFGLFQSLFALGGAIVGTTLLRFVAGIDHWVAFVLLGGLGGFMIYKSLKMDQEEKISFDLTRGFHLVGLSTAVSIDAFAAGVGLPAMQVPIILSVPVIGIITTIATLIAMLLADRFKHVLGKRIEIIAGIVLIVLGMNILLNHTFFQ
jgi:manganese efflux pump family protein